MAPYLIENHQMFDAWHGGPGLLATARVVTSLWAGSDVWTSGVTRAQATWPRLGLTLTGHSAMWTPGLGP